MPERMRSDREIVDEILDEALFCHLSYVVDGEPRVIPTLHVRIGDALYLHGSTGSRPLRMARAGLRVCVAVTIADGIVFSKAQFHHSMNYRSVIAHGVARPVTDEATKHEFLTRLVDRIATGRSHDCRPPTRKEYASTTLLELPLTEVAAKVRTGPPSEEPEDENLPYWNGILPLHTVAGEPIPLERNVPVPSYVRSWSPTAAGRRDVAPSAVPS
jgi:uncharacterized protein